MEDALSPCGLLVPAHRARSEPWLAPVNLHLFKIPFILLPARRDQGQLCGELVVRRLLHRLGKGWG